MAGRKRKKAAGEGESPSKKPCLPSSPLKPIPNPTLRPLLNRPSFKGVQLEPFDRIISSDLPQGLFDIFVLFCPADMVDQWVKYVNERHIHLDNHQEGPRQQHSLYNTWEPTCKEEIYLFFGILLYMSHVQVPSIYEYWETSSANPIHPITRFMSRDRFIQLYRRFCTWDTSNLSITSVFDKIKSWSDHIQQISTTYWKPSSEISVDEAMVRFCGRSSDTVHLPSKPIPIGYKVWVVADSGYFLKWSFHSKGDGPVEYDPSEYPKLAPTQGIVADLLNRLPSPPSPQHGYHCFMDNLFSTPELFELLRQRSITATGTTRSSRIDSKQLTTLKIDDKSKDIIPWGTVYARKHKTKEVMQLGFKDNAFVLLLSTAFDGWETSVQKLRRQPAKSSTSAKTARVPFQGQATKMLEIPQLIDAYNHHMNGVDIGDQLRSEFQTERRIRRGGQQALLYLFLLEVAVTNTYLLQRYGWANPISNQSTFRKRLYFEIFELFGRQVALRNQKLATHLSTPDEIHTKIRLPKRGFCSFCSSKRRNIILNEQQLTKRPPQKHSVITGCHECGVALCSNSKRDCWAGWHRRL